MRRSLPFLFFPCLLLAGCGGGGSNISSTSVKADFRLLGGTVTGKVALSPNGMFMAYGDTNGHLERVRVSDDSVQDLGTLGSGLLSPTGVSNDGNVVAGIQLNNGSVAGSFLWNSTAGLGAFDSLGGTTYVAGLSADGKTEVGALISENGSITQTTPASWNGDASVPLPLGTLTMDVNGFAYGVGSDGTIYGVSAGVEDAPSLVKWGSAGISQLATLSVDSGLVVAANGNAFGIQQPGPAIVDAAGHVTSLGGGSDTILLGLSADASTAVGYQSGADPSEDTAKIWRGGQESSLSDVAASAGLGTQVSGLTLEAATDVSWDGHTIAGMAHGADGVVHPFVLRLP